MKNKKEKASIDIESIHQGLIDSYHVDDNKMKKDMNEIQDFQSVTESIEKLENIIEDGKELAKKDKNYDEFLAGVKSNLIEQKSQLFKLKLSNAESNVSSMLSNIDDDATSNDFIGQYKGPMILLSEVAVFLQISLLSLIIIISFKESLNSKTGLSIEI